ncbi:MAG TPA: hypothetical protein VIO64_11105 [Pseudobacteroides sp.]|uniref:hypothetical protein n=1 Tax=Pseudobacteroides sp. TaxID=1968840 RepID=UPI002F940998
MFDILVTQEQKEYAKQLTDNVNFGIRKSGGNGSNVQQYTGILSEIVIKDLFGVARTTGDGFDGGFDFELFGAKVDVKTMCRNTYMKHDYIHNLFAVQNYDVDYYLFCSFNKQTDILTICGIISKEEFLKKSKYYAAGTIRERSNGTELELKADNYEIRQSKLKYVSCMEEVIAHAVFL